MRKRRAKKRELLPDPKFNDQLATRFVNNLMWDGKKSVAFKIFYDALDIVEQRKGDEEKSSLEIWKDALSNVMPQNEYLWIKVTLEPKLEKILFISLFFPSLRIISHSNILPEYEINFI